MNTEYAKSLAQRHGCHWFDTSSMRFFNSRVCESTWTKILVRRFADEEERVYRFVSSERFADDPRRYTVREWHQEPDLDARTGIYVHVETVGEFQQYATAKTALAHIHDGEV